MSKPPCHYQHRRRSGQGTGGLRRGLNFIWMCIVSSFFNIDSFTMMSSSPSPTPTPTAAPVAAPIDVPTPQGGAYRGLPATIPGKIQAEEFDEGGQNVAYRDTTRGNKKGVGGIDVVHAPTSMCCYMHQRARVALCDTPYLPYMYSPRQ